MAARWSEKNPNVKGAALEDAMQKQSWEPSVKGLTAVPQVLAMMSDKLDWTQQLGEAFLAQPDDVQNAIQALRAKADAAGNLKSSNEQRVKRVAATPSAGYAGPPEYIVIEPTQPDYVYVPVYNPVLVYGVGYWEPAYVPFFWYPNWWTVGPVFGFGAPFLVGPALYYNVNWGGGGFGAIQINAVQYSKFNKVKFVGDTNWKFKPEHHGKQGFKNKKLQEKFVNLNGKGVQGNKNLQNFGGKNLQDPQGNKGKQANKGLQGGKIKGAPEKNIQGAPDGNKGKKGLQANQGNKGQGGNKGHGGNKGLQANQGNKAFQANQGNKGQGGNKGHQANQGDRGNVNLKPLGPMKMGKPI